MRFSKYALAVSIISLCLPYGISANVPEGTARIASSPSDLEEDFQYSSYYSNSDSTAGSSSTVFFNDGFGRLTMFETESRDGRMTLTIRQNMNIAWKGSYAVSGYSFSVRREESLGRVFFRIQLGEHHLLGEIDSNDKWILTENGDPDDSGKMIPLSGNTSHL